MNFPAEKSHRPVPTLTLVLLMAAFSMLYMATLDQAGFWLDEVSTILDLRKGFLDMVDSRATVGHGPVYFSLVWPWYQLILPTNSGHLPKRLIVPQTPSG